MLTVNGISVLVNFRSSDRVKIFIGIYDLGYTTIEKKIVHLDQHVSELWRLNNEFCTDGQTIEFLMY